MEKSGLLKKHSLLFISAALLLSAAFVNRFSEKPLMFISKQDNSINLNNNLYNYINLGLKRFIASHIWISTIIESDIEHYKAKDLNSWMYLRFNSISLLEPKFYENYNFGGVYLSIVKDDIAGASALYKKGLSYYPDDYRLLKNASFHFHFEAQDMNASYPLFKKLEKYTDQNNPFTRTTLSRIEAYNGNLDQALALLTEYQERFKRGTNVGNKIFEYRYSLRAERDLNCLNDKKDHCERFDLENNPYLYKDGKYIAGRAWEPYRPRWKN